MSSFSNRQEQKKQQIVAKMRPLDWLIPILSIIGLYWFSASFFLAKRSLAHTASCDEAHSLLTDVLKLEPSEASLVLGEDYDVTGTTSRARNGCWMPRKVDSVVILVVDALRFDVSQYSLPKSIGARIAKKQTTSSQLLQFVADVSSLKESDGSALVGRLDVLENLWAHIILVLAIHSSHPLLQCNASKV